MTDQTKDPPLEVLPDGGSYVGTVIDLDTVRIRLGRTSFKHKRCEHKALIYCTTERRIWCEDCERTIDSFDAFRTLTRHFEGMLREASHKQATVDEAMAHSVRLRATKQLDRLWAGKMSPCCPHCNKVLLAEDFANGASSAASTEFERARRKREAANKKVDS